MLDFKAIANLFMRLWFILVIDLGVIALLVFYANADVFREFPFINDTIQLILAFGLLIFNLYVGIYFGDSTFTLGDLFHTKHKKVKNNA